MLYRIAQSGTELYCGFHFDCRLTWAAVIEKASGMFYRSLDYLDSNPLQLAYKAFIRPIME